MGRIVIDTNVFVAAGFNPRSAAARILAAVREGRFQLIWNEPTRRETRRSCAEFHTSTGRGSLIFSSPKKEFTGPVDPESFVLVPDPGDRKFAALSAAAQTPLITNDNHLLSHRDTIGVDVLTPRAFLARVGEGI
jgi:predicted nucleic acid-binding protein